MLPAGSRCPAMAAPKFRPEKRPAPRPLGGVSFCKRRRSRRRGLASLLSRIRPQQRHAPRPDTGVEDRPRHQPRRPYAPGAAARAAHPAQHVAHCPPAAIEACQIGYGEGAFAAASRREAIDGQVETREFRPTRLNPVFPLCSQHGRRKRIRPRAADRHSRQPVRCQQRRPPRWQSSARPSSESTLLPDEVRERHRFTRSGRPWNCGRRCTVPAIWFCQRSRR